MKKNTAEKKKRIRLGKKPGVFMVMLATFLAASFVWLEDYFADLTMDKLVFQMRVPMTGTNSDIVWNYLLYVVPSCTLMGVLLHLLLRKKKSDEGEKKPSKLSRFWGWLRRHLNAVSGGFLLVTVIFGLARYQIPTYLYDQTHPSKLYENYYVDPDRVELRFPEEKRNLIYIFLESFENTYASGEYGGYQEENLIPNLTDLQRREGSVYFSQPGGYGMLEMANCSWTMASMVAQTSGIPLSIPLANNDYNMYHTFLPGVATIGEILEDQGYNQVLLLGSEAAFAGTDHYFEQHGDYDIRDYKYALEQGWIPEDYYEWWGYEDHKLLDFAREEAVRLAEEGEPFNLTLATMDTHCVDGYTCDLCQDQYEEPYYNVISCADRQLSEFVRWVKEQPFGENTTIILCGDHLTMDARYSESVDEDFSRSLYQVIVNPAAEPEKTTDREFCALDLFPTTLAALGAEIPGERLGLGTNLFSGEETLCEQMGSEELADQIKKVSKYYNRHFLYSSPRRQTAK